MKLVSVIIPTHGGGKYLSRTINSVLKQEYNNIEIIVVDDNGRNTKNQLSTKKIINSYLQNSNIHYLVHEYNYNGSVARNTGFNNASGDYISLLDDDDVYLESKIKLQVEALDKLDNSWGMAYCSYIKYKNGVYSEKVKANKEGNILYEILMHDPSATSGSLLIRREVYKSLQGFNENFKRHQDWEFTARVAYHYKIAAVPQVGVLKNLYFRNAPSDQIKIKEYRKKYLDSIISFASILPRRKQKIVFYYNIFEATSSYFKNEGFKSFLKEYKRLIYRYYKIFRVDIFFIVVFMKIIQKGKKLILSKINYF